MSNATLLQWRRASTGDSAALPPGKFRLGGFLVDPRGLVLRNGVSTKHIERKAMEVLVCLARRAPETVPRERLFDEAWEGAYVSDGVLNRVISILRKALGDDPRSPRYIETVPRVGYRLLLPAEWEGVPEPKVESVSGGNHRISRLWPALALATLLGSAAVWLLTGTRVAMEENVNLRPITSSPGFEILPTLANNGRWIAYTGYDAPGSGGGGIYVASRDGGRAPRLFVPATESEFAYYPVWSPDGTELAWHQAGLDGECAILTQALVADTPERMFDCTQVTALDWSPDGRYLLVTQGQPGNPEAPVLELDLDSGRTRVAVPEQQGYLDLEAHYSPDGEQLATMRMHIGTTITAAIYDRAGRFLSEYRPPRGTVQGLDWLTSDELLLSLDYGSGIPSLWRYRISSGEVSRIAETNGARTPAAVDGMAVFSRYSVRSRIWQLHLNGPSEPLIRSESTQLDRHPAEAPDGSQLVFVSNRSGDLQLWMEKGSGEALQVTALENDWMGSPRWRHDGRALLLEAHYDGFVSYQLDPVTRSVEPLEHPFDEVREPIWGPSGEIIVAVESDNDWQLWSDGGIGAWQQVTENGGLVAAFSPEGDTIYYTKFNRPGLWRRSWPVSANAEEVLVEPDLSYADRRQWTPITGGVVLPRRTQGENQDLVAITAEGEQVLASLENVHLRGVSASGPRVLYSAFEILGADLYELDLGGT